MNEFDFFEWDEDVVEDAEEFITFMPGTYKFEIKDIEKARQEGGKMDGCAVAKVYVQAENTEGKKTTIIDNLFLARKMEWKISQFLTAVGLKKKGEAVQASKIVQSIGKTGFCNVGCQSDKEEGYRTLKAEEAEQYLKDGKAVFNKITKYILPKEDEAETVEEDRFEF